MTRAGLKLPRGFNIDGCSEVPLAVFLQCLCAYPVFSVVKIFLGLSTNAGRAFDCYNPMKLAPYHALAADNYQLAPAFQLQ
jgi:hypothetical protein